MEGSWKKKKTASGSLGKKREAISKRKNKNKKFINRRRESLSQQFIKKGRR